ncbi:MAG: 4-demethylwyosine synthase TYW1 [Candidatus Micrarchaeaceae archaeon]
MEAIPEKLHLLMVKQGYHFVGTHSAVKICEYTAKGLQGKTLCYKNKFYGIRSWRCLQATPAIGCDLSCRFCWRNIPEEIGISWNELNAVKNWDDPEDIVKGMIEAQRKIVSGYKATADSKLKMQRWHEANHPLHATLSLTGEPTFYPKLSTLIQQFHNLGMSTFLVTNGTLPEALKELNPLPTQLYISLQAPDEETYLKTTRPKINDAWKRFLEALSFMSTVKTRTVLRMTLVKGLNMLNPEGYAKLIKLANPMYVEVKGFSYVGGSRSPERGLSMASMPNHKEIKDFANEITKYTGYTYTDEHELSRIVLLSRDKAASDNRIINFNDGI